MAAGQTAVARDATPIGGSPLTKIEEYLVETNYAELGCDRWSTKRVQELCVKIGCTPKIMAARMRLKPAEFQRRYDSGIWTRQDGLILTILEREIDFIRGGKIPRGSLFGNGL